MFNSISNTYYGTATSRRSGSKDTLFSFSQNSSTADSQGRRSSVGLSEQKSSTRQKSVTSLEPPCCPTTIRLIEKAATNCTHSIYGNTETGPVSIVGWPVHQKDARFSTGDTHFKLCDGTGTLLIRLDIHSDNESWLLEKIKLLVLGSGHRSTENRSLDTVNDGACTKKDDLIFDSHLQDDSLNDYRLSYLRVIGTISWDDKPPALRCIHVRAASAQEASFYHTFDCIWTALKLLPEFQGQTHSINNDVSNNSSVPIGRHKAATNTLENVDLPDIFSSCGDEYQLQILRYLMRYREPETGVLRTRLESELVSMGFNDSTRIQQGIEDLMSAAFCMETEQGFIDVVVEEDNS